MNTTKVNAWGFVIIPVATVLATAVISWVTPDYDYGYECYTNDENCLQKYQEPEDEKDGPGLTSNESIDGGYDDEDYEDYDDEDYTEDEDEDEDYYDSDYIEDTEDDQSA